jgi:two-component system nitrate/nitrite response regulator NarL
VRPYNVGAVHILLATDADWIVDEVTAALGGPDTSFTVCREGRLVSKLVGERAPDLAVLDLQVGSMGGMAIAMALRLDESGGLLPHVRVLMLLDRVADVYLAQRSSADGWLIKPLDALRLKRAALAAVSGEIFQEGVPRPMPVTPTVPIEADGAATAAKEPAEEEPAEEEPAPAG